MTNQSDRQESVRNITSTVFDYNGDWSALFDAAGIPAGDFNGRFLQWINAQLSSSYTELNGAMAAYAASQGVSNWDSLGASNPRAIASNGNVIPFQADSRTTNEISNIHRKFVPLNANYSQNQWSFVSYIDTATTELLTTTTLTLRACVYTRTQAYQLTFGGSTSVTISPNDTLGVTSDIVPSLVLPAGSEYLMAVEITGPDTTSRTYPRSCVSWNAFGEGAVYGTTRLGIADGTFPFGGEASVTISGGNITAGAVTNGGYNYSTTAQVYAIEENANGYALSKQVGTAAVSGGVITSITITSGTPPAGLAAWVNPKIVIAYGDTRVQPVNAVAGFTQALHTGIPSVPVKSLLMVGHSIVRGNGQVQPPMIRGNQGIYENGLANRCGVMNAGIGSGKLALLSNYGANYPKLFSFISRFATDVIISDGTNDLNFDSRTYTQLKGYYDTLKAYFNGLGMRVSTTTMLNRTDAANTTPNTGFGSGGTAETWNTNVRNSTVVSDVAFIDGQALLGSGFLWRTDKGTVQTDGVHPIQDGLGIAGQDATFKAQFNSYA